MRSRFFIFTGPTVLGRDGNLYGATAINGTDYQPVPTTVTIPAGNAKARIKLLPTDRGLKGSSKTVIVKLKPATDGSYTLGDPFKATVTLIDND